jgi:chitodextrinase
VSRPLGLNPARRRRAGAAPPGDTEAPSVPQNLVATAVSSSQIDLTWDASTDNVAVVGYRIYRDNALVHTSPTNAYSDTGLAPATEYEYEVSAIDAVSNESARSTPASATTESADAEAPSVPQNLSATAVSSSQIDLTWDASTDNVGVTGYNIYRDNVLVDTSPTNAYSDTGLAPATEYEYEISAFDAASNGSARSAPDSATTHQVIVTAGLLAEWRFDDGAGQVLTDHSGNGNSGQLGSTTGADAADPTWTAQGLSFDGGDFVDCGTVGISGTQARTLIYVGKSSGTGSTQLMSAQWNESTSAGRRWTLRAVNASGLKLRLEIEGAGHTSALAVAENQWHFVGCTQSGANVNTAVLYANGASEAVTASATINTQNTFRFGRHNALGQVCQFAYALVYDRALSPAEVEQNRQALKAILAGRAIALP